MLRRIVNLPFKIIGKAARAVQEREDAAAQQRALDLTAASRARPSGNRPAMDVPDDFALAGVEIPAAAALDRLHAADSTHRVLVVDVREPDRVAAGGHVPAAMALPLSTLSLDLAELPARTCFLVLDEDTDRASLAARFLRFRGLDETFYIEGGISAWRAVGGAWAEGLPSVP